MIPTTIQLTTSENYSNSPALTDHRRSPKYSGNRLLQVSMPMGGIGAGSICLSGNGALQNFALRQKPNTTALPDGHGVTDGVFAIVHVKGAEPVTRLVEGPIPVEKLYDQGLQAQGYRKGGHEGLPRFAECEFQGEYPFGCVRLRDDKLPISATVTGWNPFIPGDDVSSGIPAAILEYEIENHSEETVEIELSFHASHLAVGAQGWKGARSKAIDRGVVFTNTEGRFDESFGSATITSLAHDAKVKGSWFRGGWFDAIAMIWNEISAGKFREISGTGDKEDDGSRVGGSLLVPVTIAPGESVTIPFAVTWHFPNSNQVVGLDQSACGTDCDCDTVQVGPRWRPFYAGVWKDSTAVANHVAAEYESLRARTLAFKDALYSSTLPSVALDAIASNLAILKSPTVLRQENGNVWAWEGCFTSSGCCHGSCTHVWNYAQAMPHLFPKLERTLREQEMERSMNDIGHVNFRSALPDGPTSHDYHPAADGQLGGVMKIYREWQISGDSAWLARMYPLAKRSLDFCIDRWDPERKGGLFEPHHNTYDIEFWGPDGMCGSVYVGALSALSAMAAALGIPEDEATYKKHAQAAAAYTDEDLFNGEYYQQNVQWRGLRDQWFEKNLDTADLSEETRELYRVEGPKYQYGAGCLSDGIIGHWMSTIYGIETPLDLAKVGSTLDSIYRYNFKSDLSEHACTQRPGYATGREAGLVLCTWPKGGKPSLPFVYSDEVWTGIEYQVASHLIEMGRVKEGLTIVAAARSRYDGHVRNPYDEYECGSYYARAMASYSLLASLSGFRYSAVDKTLWFGPRLDTSPFTSFFCNRNRLWNDHPISE